MEQLGYDFWKNLIAELEDSDLPRQAFADRHRVSVSTLRPWVYKHRRAQREVPAFAPVQLDSSTDVNGNG